MVQEVTLHELAQRRDREQRARSLLTDRATSLTITPDTIVTLLRYAMESVELVKVDDAEERRELIVALVRQAIVDAPITDEKERLLLDMVDEGVVGHVIDLVNDASSGRLNAAAAGGVAMACVESIGFDAILGAGARLLCCGRRKEAPPPS